jgi:hypothetical protein
MHMYMKVIWHHDSPDEPCLLYSEIDEAGYETRKVDVYSDGRRDYADGTRSTGTTFLGEKPVPPIEFIASQAEFSPFHIEQDEFEEAWRLAVGE